MSWIPFDFIAHQPLLSIEKQIMICCIFADTRQTNVGQYLLCIIVGRHFLAKNGIEFILFSEIKVSKSGFFD